MAPFVPCNTYDHQAMVGHRRRLDASSVFTLEASSEPRSVYAAYAWSDEWVEQSASDSSQQDTMTVKISKHMLTEENSKFLKDQLAKGHTFPFEKLPTELRHMVYALVLPVIGSIKLRTTSRREKKVHSRALVTLNRLSILLVSGVSEEATRFWYGSITFCFAHASALANFLRPMSAFVLNSLRRVRIDGLASGLRKNFEVLSRARTTLTSLTIKQYCLRNSGIAVQFIMACLGEYIYDIEVPMEIRARRVNGLDFYGAEHKRRGCCPGRSTTCDHPACEVPCDCFTPEFKTIVKNKIRALFDIPN
ncbi:hypothetical protein LTR50_007291 [Elasticomyces elasticus]|nr:hypothetical protein LTR50_007291 [Elasticomyces elasticus]